MMIHPKPRRFGAIVFAALLLTLLGETVGQSQETAKSIGGKEHDDNILGVRIGMTVPQALEAVFVNGNRKPGQEKPDAMRNEGVDKKDVRVLYNDLKVGKVQIVFAQSKWVKEIVLDYSQRPLYDAIRLAPSGNIGDAMGGERYDDRYTIAFTEESAAKRQRIWYRDEKSQLGFRERIQFVSAKKPDDATIEGKQIVQKVILVVPADLDKFLKAMQQ